MLTIEKTADYVKRWVAAFESKDVDRVLAFYTNDVIFHSPLIARLSHDRFRAGEPRRHSALKMNRP